MEKHIEVTNKTVEEKLMDIQGTLAEMGIRPSYQRVKIYEFLLKNKIHPSVDTVYNALKHEMVTLSKTTVYNTVKNFLEKGLLIPIVIEEGMVRYDADTSFHGHFQCTICNEVHDFFVDSKIYKKSIGDKFKVTEHHLYLKGECLSCRN